MRTNYILIDFESVQPKSLEPLTHDHFKVIVFVGASQAKLSFEIAESMQQLGSRAQYIRISGKGSNALDFHIAYYIGLLAAAEPSAYFHIISKDTGFDPLIQHLRSRKILAGRVHSVGEIPVLKNSNAKSSQEQIAIIVARLQQLNHAKPRTRKTLSSTIASLFQNQLSEPEVAGLVAILASKGHVEITGEKVSYAKK
ncbi:MAG TPA: PIN domain-containing protein [Pyrinomonadaceae bacterium]|nr:PIN domain-containing protein [Pyrinomonadaceae bacterium]